MASLMCLPVVVCNLGSEMIYILEQRLRAQSITSEKSVKAGPLYKLHAVGPQLESTRFHCALEQEYWFPSLCFKMQHMYHYGTVLHDVVKSMFDPTFVSELFKPQDVYSQRSTRQIFNKLAHSSIMRLSESSMAGAGTWHFSLRVIIL
jgi:hypothetical protein